LLDDIAEEEASSEAATIKPAHEHGGKLMLG